MSDVRPKVSSLSIEVTAYCQQKCDYCYNAWRDETHAVDGGSDMEATVARVARLFSAWDVESVTVTGGEPLSRKDLFELLRVLQARRIRTQIISNGGLVTDAVARRLVECDVGSVQIALNGPTETVHGAHVGAGFFDRTVRGVQTLRAHGVSVVGCVVVTRKNAAYVGETLRLWESLGVRTVALSRFSPAGYAANHVAELLPDQGDLAMGLGQAKPFAEGGMALYCTMPIPPCLLETEAYHPIRFGSCAIGTSKQQFALGPDGRLRNCTLHERPIGSGLDVLDPRFDPIAVLGDPDVVLYKASVPPFCTGCIHASSCGGGCGAAAAWVLGGTRHWPDPILWQHVDDAFGERIRRERGTLASTERRDRGRRLRVVP